MPLPPVIKKERQISYKTSRCNWLLPLSASLFAQPLASWYTCSSFTYHCRWSKYLQLAKRFVSKEEMRPMDGKESDSIWTLVNQRSQERLRPNLIAQSSATMLLAMPTWMEKPLIQIPFESRKRLPTPAKPRLQHSHPH